MKVRPAQRLHAMWAARASRWSKQSQPGACGERVERSEQDQQARPAAPCGAHRHHDSGSALKNTWLANGGEASHAASLAMAWRKGMGVEPTRQRMAPPTGFEARPIHRDGCPSLMSGGVPRPRQRQAAGARGALSVIYALAPPCGHAAMCPCGQRLSPVRRVVPPYSAPRLSHAQTRCPRGPALAAPQALLFVARFGLAQLPPGVRHE